MTRKIVYWKQATLILAVSLIPQIAATNAVQAQTGYVATVKSEPSLFAYWRFDGDTGVTGSAAYDELGNNNGTYVDTSTNMVTGAPIGEPTNKAPDFQHSWSAINVGTLPGFGQVLDYGATVEMWVKADTGSGLSDGDQCPFGLYDESGMNTLFINLDERPSGAAEEDRIRVYCSWAGTAGADFDTDVTDGTWTYLAVALNVANAVESERLKIYIAKPGDSVTTEYTSTTPGTPLTPPNQAEWPNDFVRDLCIGCMNTMNGRLVPFEGIIDEFALYTDALSKTQIDAHWAAASIAAPNRPGDADGDGMVDEDDAAALAAHWLTQSDATWEMGDFNGDEKVDDADATIMANNWHYGVVEAVPEPSTLVILLSMALTWLLCSRKK